MPFELLGKGLLIGIVFGVPAGAIGALTIQKTLEGGFLYGFFTGLGSSAADILYATVGIFGITFVTSFLQRYEIACNVGGAILIIVYGILILRKKDSARQSGKISGKTYLSGFMTAFTIAIINPATVLSFLVAFSAVGLIGQYSLVQGLQIVIGVLLGTTLWWGMLSAVVKHFKTRITDKIYGRMNMVLGCMLIGFGAVMIIRCFW